MRIGIDIYLNAPYGTTIISFLLLLIIFPTGRNPKFASSSFFY